MKKLTITLLLLAWGILSFSQGIYNNGARIVSNTGSYWVVDNGSFTLTSTSATNLAQIANLKITNDASLTLGNASAPSYLSVSQNLTVESGGTLTIISNTNGTSSLVVTGTPSGTVTMERYMNNADWTNWKDGWHFLASPVSGQAISPNFITDPANTYDFFCWYELTNEWVNFKNTTTIPTWATANTINNGLTEISSNFLVGKGYMAAYDDEGTKSFSGSLNNANVTISDLDISSGSNRSWHLLGNPYSSGLTWDVTWDKANIAGAIQIWNESGQSYSSIAAEPGGIIPATNGFMIQVSSGTGSITIPHGKCTHGGTFYKASSFPTIKMKAVNLDFPSFQETQLLFNPASTKRYEMEYDGDFLPGYAPYFYSEIEGEPMAVNSMPLLTENTNIPLTFIKNDGLNFSIELYETELVPFNIWLLDTKTNQDHNLSTNPTYLFTSLEQDDPNRFLLHFKAVGIDEPMTSGQELSILVWNHEQTLTITNPEQLSGTVMVYDMTGKCALTEKLQNVTKQIITHTLKPALYVVRINANNNIKCQKIMIQ